MKSRDLTFTLELNISAEELWRFWLEPSKLQSWLTQKANIEPNIGGAFELFWDPSTPSDNSTLGCKILAMVPNKLLSFEWRGPVPYADIMNVEPFPTWVSISFERMDINNTTLHFRHTGWMDSEKWNEAKTWQTTAWKMAFEQLKRVIAE